MSSVNVVGVQFRRAGKIYDFAAGDQTLRVGDQVVVDTDRGPCLAQVARLKFSESADYSEQGLKSVLRRATQKDLNGSSRISSEKAMEIAAEKISSLKLDMRVMKVETQLGGNKAIIYFTSPGRVDFRDLVKDLASSLKTRVELKQVGSRDEAKLLGGVGICGREFCCSSFLREFVPVSIKMAKNQNLALNPTKISGGCGRLLCCLTYEDKTYKALSKLMPARGTHMRVVEEGVRGDVLKGDVINQSVLLELEDGRQATYKLADLERVQVSAREQVEDDWGQDLDLGELSEVAAKQQTSSPDTKPRSQNSNQRLRERGRSRPDRNEDSRGHSSQNQRNEDVSSQSGQEKSDGSGKSKKRRGGRGRNRKPKKS